jgi:hypothetical protein
MSVYGVGGHFATSGYACYDPSCTIGIFAIDNHYHYHFSMPTKIHQFFRHQKFIIALCLITNACTPPNMW